MLRSILVSAALLLVAACPTFAQTFPSFAELKPQAEFPDPLTTLAGKKITTVADWESTRRPELKQLFQHYMYGKLPPKQIALGINVLFNDPKYKGGKATLCEVELDFTMQLGDKVTVLDRKLRVLLITPNSKKPVPAFVGMNFCGNHAVLDDDRVQIPKSWIYKSCNGVVNEKATAAGRGSQADVWNVDLILERGYGLATFYSGDIDPDTADFSDGLAADLKPDLKFAPDDPGTIACWAWGYHRVVDLIAHWAKAPETGSIDAKKIAVVGHSRNGKAALFAAAMDDRIALAIPTQAGCGGTAPNRLSEEIRQSNKVETVKRINTSFPHWFCDEFTNFSDEPQRLPFDQNCLAALCAPRPILFANAQDDQWANPDGQLEILKAAAPAYALYGKRGIDAGAKVEMGQLVGQELGYFIRPGKHSMNREDWQAFLTFADKHFAE